jgi:hypothetical protein
MIALYKSHVRAYPAVEWSLSSKIMYTNLMKGNYKERSSLATEHVHVILAQCVEYGIFTRNASSNRYTNDIFGKTINRLARPSSPQKNAQSNIRND